MRRKNQVLLDNIAVMEKATNQGINLNSITVELQVEGVHEEYEAVYVDDLASADDKNVEYGTEFSGFASDGPFSCKDCVHKQVIGGSGVCRHPKVNKDPKLADRSRKDDFMIVDSTDCCRYVRPKGD